MLIGRKVRDIVRMDGISGLACRSIAYAYREMMDRIWKQTRAARAYRGVMDRIWKQPRAARATERGYKSNFIWPSATVKPAGATHLNALHKFFDNRKQGPGIWKRNHYFDIYDRHFRQFRGQEGHVLEIGVYSGGSLDMWRDYFGPKAIIYGVDTEPDCRVYENDGVKIFIGDQADRSFWREFRRKVPALDIVIDDGGHQPEQQREKLRTRCCVSRRLGWSRRA